MNKRLTVIAVLVGLMTVSVMARPDFKQKNKKCTKVEQQSSKCSNAKQHRRCRENQQQKNKQRKRVKKHGQSV